MLQYTNFEDVCVAASLNERNGARIMLYLYAVDGLMLDCGPEILSDDIKEFIEKNDIYQAALSHLHEDHCGMAHYVADELHIPVYTNPECIKEAGKDAQYAEYRRLSWGDRPAFTAMPIPDIIKTPKYSLEVISAPGHSDDHLVFFERSRGWLFAGDLYVRPRSKFSYYEENLSLQIVTIEKILELPVKTVFCVHAGVLENGRERLEEKLSFLKDMQKTVRARRAEGKTNKEIEKELFPEEHIITLISEGEWSAYRMIETL